MKRLTLFIVVILGLSSCEKVDLSNNNSIALGHGGMGIGYSYPINSFESIQNCLSIGAAGSEMDIQMTSDSVLVLFHDEFLDDATNNSGRIYTKTWAELSDVSYTDPPYTSYKVINIDQLFANITNPSEYTFFFDCKNFKPDDSPEYVNTFINALTKIIDKYDLTENVIVEQKRISIIESLRIERPEIKIFKYGDYAESLNTAIEFDLAGITVPIDNVSDNVLSDVHNNGLQIAVFNCHSKERNREALEKNIDYIQSDRIRHLVRILD